VIKAVARSSMARGIRREDRVAAHQCAGVAVAWRQAKLVCGNLAIKHISGDGGEIGRRRQTST